MKGKAVPLPVQGKISGKERSPLAVKTPARPKVLTYARKPPLALAAVNLYRRSNKNCPLAGLAAVCRSGQSRDM